MEDKSLLLFVVVVSILSARALQLVVSRSCDLYDVCSCDVVRVLETNDVLLGHEAYDVSHFTPIRETGTTYLYYRAAVTHKLTSTTESKISHHHDIILNVASVPTKRYLLLSPLSLYRVSSLLIQHRT